MSVGIDKPSDLRRSSDDRVHCFRSEHQPQTRVYQCPTSVIADPSFGTASSLVNRLACDTVSSHIPSKILPSLHDLAVLACEACSTHSM